MRILLTGARAPATLELARLCARAGHVVHVADSVGWHVCRGSRLVAGIHTLPPARERAPWRQALNALIDRERLEVVIPTCEEVFHLAAVRETLHARAIVEPLSRLRVLHDKWQFVGACAAAGVPAPTTHLLDSETDAASLPAGRYFLKRRYSRFAAAAMPWETGKPLPPLPRVGPAGWIAQTHLEGVPLCTWSVAERGTVRAHATYRVIETAGPYGAAICFESVRHADALRWVTQFIRHHGLSGQFAFDFIATPRGLSAIECNPRLTSGVHLFRGTDGVATALLATGDATIDLPLEPPEGRVFRSRLALALYRKRSYPGAGLLDAADDPWPQRLQLGAWSSLLVRALIHRTDPRALSTADIEWNGE